MHTDSTMYDSQSKGRQYRNSALIRESKALYILCRKLVKESEIHFCIVVAAFQQLFHFFLAGLTRIGSGAGITDGILCDFRQTSRNTSSGTKPCSVG